jgi:hypothetical protein
VAGIDVDVEMYVWAKALHASARGSGGGWGEPQEAPYLADMIARAVSTLPEDTL